MSTELNTLSQEELLYLKMDIYFLTKKYYLSLLHFKDAHIKYQYSIQYLNKILPPSSAQLEANYWEILFPSEDIVVGVRPKHVPFNRRHLLSYYLKHKGLSTAKTANLLGMSPNTLHKLKNEPMPMIFLSNDEKEIQHFYDTWRKMQISWDRMGLKPL